MRYLYTTTPDENCHEVTKGIYGRPVHTSQQKALLAQGWKFRVSDLEKSYVRQEKEGREEGEEVSEPFVNHGMIDGNRKIAEAFSSNDRDLLVEVYEDMFGKKPHHKMKAETIRQNIEDSI